jgi:hypothetical protein
MDSQPIQYPVTIGGKSMILQFDISESETKKGVNMQFVMDKEPADIRDKDEIKNKLSIILQKKFGGAGIPIDFNERNPYDNVISFIVPIGALADTLVKVLKGQK